MRWSIALSGSLLGAALAAAGVYYLSAGAAAPTAPTSVARPAPPRLVLLYAPCTVTAHHLGPYNPAVEYTPHLTAFGRDAVVFTRHQGEAGRSAIDYAALFTGTDAIEHRVFSNRDGLADDAYTIDEAFRDAGYDTFFWSGHPFGGPSRNFGQGVGETGLVDGNAGMGLQPYHVRGYLRAGDPAFAALLDRLRRQPDERAFVMTNFSVTHSPYDPSHRPAFCTAHPSECAGLSEADFERYTTLWTDNFGLLSLAPDAQAKLGLTDAEFSTMARVVEVLFISNLAHLDAQFGAVVEAIAAHGLLDESMIVLTADHGEILHRANTRYPWTHGFELAPETLAIPLLIRAPGLQPRAYESVTRSVDVMPTLLALASIESRRGGRGRGMVGVDLAPALRGESAPPPLTAFSHTTLIRRAGTKLSDPDAMLVGLREGDRFYGYQRTPTGRIGRAVFDWAMDPGQTRNLYTPADAETFQRIDHHRHALLEAYRQQAKRRPSLTAAQREHLRQLGYGDDR